LTEAAAAAPGGRAGARALAPGGEPLARIVFAALVLACFAAFLITQRLKHTPTAVHRYQLANSFSPYAAGPAKLEAIAFELADTEDVTVTIVDGDGNTVATLVRDYPLVRYKEFSLRWNGRRGTARSYGHQVTLAGRRILVPRTDGRIAAPGEYRVGVSLRHRGQHLLLPRSFTLVKP
jgi:hypothetical protein